MKGLSNVRGVTLRDGFWGRGSVTLGVKIRDEFWGSKSEMNFGGGSKSGSGKGLSNVRRVKLRDGFWGRGSVTVVLYF